MLLSRLWKPVAYTETTCVPDLSIDLVALNDTSGWKYDILRNDGKMLQSFTKILFNLSLVTTAKYWFISHFDKRFTVVVEYIREQIIIDSTEVSMNIGQVFGVSLYWKPRVVMTPPLSSPGALQVVITMVTCGNHSDDKVGFMIIVDFRYYTHGLVNIRMTIAIHCHLSRFLESESLSYYRVLDTLVRVRDRA